MTTQNRNIADVKPESGSKPGSSFYIFAFPLFIILFVILGITQIHQEKSSIAKEKVVLSDYFDTSNQPKINFTALLMPDEFSAGLRDTVFTDKDKYLELRIDKQTLYVHYRDGRVKSYLVSTGNPYASKSVESRPGLFAIFLKEELHLSSQFNNAKMYNYMPYNMGIGFHGLAGTGYYSHLGVRPSSHGCIRMRNEDVRVLFRECEIGTIVISHFGKSARVIAFADSNDFVKHDRKEDLMKILAYNLNILYEGKYFINSPKRFIINTSLIPRNGFNIGNIDNVPERQMLPSIKTRYVTRSDRLIKENLISSVNENLDSELALSLGLNPVEELTDSSGIYVDEEVVNKLAFNKAGILPYFPPNR